MYGKVCDTTVQKNIALFAGILRKANNGQTDAGDRAFKAFIHRKKGEISFSEPSLDSHDWIALSFYLFSSEHGTFFDISGSDEYLFSWEALHPQAITTLKETVKTIRVTSRFLPGFKKISSDDLIREAWHEVDREECERILLTEKERTGTFLFRKDFFASLLEEQLRQVFPDPIRCVTLTLLETHRKVSDFTLVQKKEGWTVYDDDPAFGGRFYSSVQELLRDHFKETAKKPLFS